MRNPSSEQLHLFSPSSNAPPQSSNSNLNIQINSRNININIINQADKHPANDESSEIKRRVATSGSYLDKGNLAE